MPIHASYPAGDRRRLLHDFSNDLNSLKMNLEVMQMARDDPDEFAQLVDLMQSTIKCHQARIDAVLKLVLDVEVVPLADA